MKTENTLENKAKFIALYWGQNVFKYDREGSTIDKFEIGNLQYIPKSRALDFSFLELIALSKITDEDALELSKFKQKIDNETNMLVFNSKDSAIRYVKNNINLCLSGKSKNVDWLRSKGYAVDWMDLSVEDLETYGWIKVKSN